MSKKAGSGTSSLFCLNMVGYKDIVNKLDYFKKSERFEDKKMISLKIDKEALENGFIIIESENNKDILDEYKLEQIESKYGIYGELILNKNYELVYLNHVILSEENLEGLKELPIKGIYSISEMNIYNVSFPELISYIII